MFRHDLDEVLDTKFSDYNKANTVFAETRNELSKLGQFMGRKFRLSDTFADARAGIVLRRIMSNAQSRSGILQLLESVQNTAKKHGMKINEDVITQSGFADILEKALGSEAPTSFLGGVERGTEQAISTTAEVLGGHPVKAGLKLLGKGYESLRGVNQENMIKALRELLQRR